MLLSGVSVAFAVEEITVGNYTYTVLGDNATIVSCSEKATGNLNIPSTLGGKTVTAIGDGAFQACTVVTGIIIPSTVKTIGKNAFAFCFSLTKIEIPSSVTSINSNAFSRCTKLSDVYYSGSEEEWGKIEFGSNNDLLTIATIHYNSSGFGDTDSDDDNPNKKTITGTLKDYTITTMVVINGEEYYDYVSDITVDGTKYSVKDKDLIPESLAKRLLNERVVIEVENGVVTSFKEKQGTGNDTSFEDDDYERNKYIQQHIDFVKSGDGIYSIATRYYRFAKNIWENMDSGIKTTAEFVYDIIEGSLEVITFQAFDGLKATINPYDAILLDFLSSGVTQSQFADTAKEDAFSIAITIINDLVKMFDFDVKWSEKFDFKKELKSLITKSDYSDNALYRELNTLLNGKGKKEITTIFQSFECCGKLLSILDVGLSTADFFVEMLRYSVAIEGYYKSSEVFKQTLNLIAEEMCNVQESYAEKFQESLDFYKKSLNYDYIVECVIKNKGISGGIDLIYNLSSGILSKATYSMIMSIFKIGSELAGKINAALWASEVGFYFSNLITGNNTVVNCRRLMRANYMLDIATYNVMDHFKTTLLKNKGYDESLFFDSCFNIFKNNQLFSLNQYKKYCETLASKPLTISKSSFKNETEDIAGRIVTWKKFICHYDMENNKDNKVLVETVVVACPTDVNVYRKTDDSLVASVKNNIPISYSDEVSITCIGTEKAVAAPSIDNYRIEILATDDGTMNVNYSSYSDLNNINGFEFKDFVIRANERFDINHTDESLVRDDGICFYQDGSIGGCSCNCHKTGFMGFIYKIIRIFWKLFRIHQTCECGVKHY